MRPVVAFATAGVLLGACGDGAEPAPDPTAGTLEQATDAIRQACHRPGAS